MGKVDDDGKPDVAGWLEHVTTNESITRKSTFATKSGRRPRSRSWSATTCRSRTRTWSAATKPTTAPRFAAARSCSTISAALRKSGTRPARHWPRTRTRHGQGLWRPGRGVLDRSRQPLAARRSAADSEVSADSRMLEKEAFTLDRRKPAVGHRAGRRHLRDPVLRGPHQADRHQLRRSQEAAATRDIHEKKLRVAMAKAFDELQGQLARRQLPDRRDQGRQEGRRRQPRCDRSTRECRRPKCSSGKREIAQRANIPAAGCRVLDRRPATARNVRRDGPQGAFRANRPLRYAKGWPCGNLRRVASPACRWAACPVPGPSRRAR